MNTLLSVEAQTIGIPSVLERAKGNQIRYKGDDCEAQRAKAEQMGARKLRVVVINVRACSSVCAVSGKRARAKRSTKCSFVNFLELWVNHGCRREASASEEGRASGERAARRAQLFSRYTSASAQYLFSRAFHSHSPRARFSLASGCARQSSSSTNQS